MKTTSLVLALLLPCALGGGCTLVVMNRAECDTQHPLCPVGYRCQEGDCVLIEPDADADTDADTDTDTDTDADVDITCPQDDMVRIPDTLVCIDRYEASQGPGGEAVSAAGVIPWVEVTWDGADYACAMAGKRLCDADEWIRACEGPAENTYPYGNAFNPQACNGCGYWENCLELHTIATGSVETCEGGVAGLFDMSGNVAEWTAGCDYFCDVMGGSSWGFERSITCRSRQELSPEHDQWRTDIGFRCCLSL
jgi:hypothetical protein